MRVLFDIVHPADVLFFLGPMRALEDRGDEILILSRKKDIACKLLDQFDLKHTSVSSAGKGLVGLGRELVGRDLAVARAALRFKPHVMIGLGGVSISHAGKLLGIPSVSFYMADNANLQTRLTWPFISHLYVPEAYAGPVPAGRTTRFSGVKEQSYFHPENFTADRDIALGNGLDPDRPNFLIRTVAWNANHDIGKSGWSDEVLVQLCEHLGARGKVMITSERDLPQQIAHLKYTGASNQLHHVMAHCDLYVGESATMAHEAAFLGAPAIYDGADHPGTTRDLQSAGLIEALRQEGPERLFEAIDRQLKVSHSDMADRLAAYLTDRPNLGRYIVEAIDRHAKSGKSSSNAKPSSNAPSESRAELRSL